MAEKRPVFHRDLGLFFTALREAKGWKQAQAADVAARRRIAVSYQTIRGIEEGKTKNADPEALRAIAKLYDHPYELIAAEVFRARYGVQAVGSDLIWQSVEEGSGLPTHTGDPAHDPASARILELERLVREQEIALGKVQDVASQLVQIAKVGAKVPAAAAGGPSRGRRNRKTG
ncbi:MAG: helix-turn-helix transcriptional regulator [Acidobacteriota bacterium]|nr:helix-turn-helix transcriptional regulator [Acidobacteriota bacterium]